MEFIKKLFRKKRIGTRSQSRVACNIYRVRSKSSFDAKIIEVSELGLAFILATPLCEVGDLLELRFNCLGSKALPFRGTIVSQKIYYPEFSQELKFARYRFSVQLESPFAENQLEVIQQSIEPG